MTTSVFELQMGNIIRFLKNDTGATVAEYSIMAALIAAVIVGSIMIFGEQVKGLFNLCLAEMTKHNI